MIEIEYDLYSIDRFGSIPRYLSWTNGEEKREIRGFVKTCKTKKRCHDASNCLLPSSWPKSKQLDSTEVETLGSRRCTDKKHVWSPNDVHDTSAFLGHCAAWIKFSFTEIV